MNCQEIQERLSDYCDRELATSERAQVDLHLETCADCRAELAAEREIVRQAAAWQRDVAPQRDLWPDIEARIDSKPARVIQGPWFAVSKVALVAAAAVIAAVTLIVVRQPEPPMAGQVGASQAPATRVEGPASVPMSALALASERARAEGGLMHVREDLLRSIAMRQGELDAETQEMVERNLGIIDRAIGEIYQALEEDPDNRVLEQLLATTYQREAEFLKQINTL